MADVKVWDERDDYTACTWRSTLMVIVASGFNSFPLGIYTVAEAQAFRAGNPTLNFSGPVAHAASRYGINVISPTPYSPDGLRAALSTTGRAYAVAGRTANFPAGHSIRRWDPVFAGFHAVCVVPLGGGQCLWLDPLAYTGFDGDTVTVGDVVDTFAAGNYPNDARYLPLKVEDDMKLQGTPITPLQNKKVTVRAGTTFVKDPARVDVGANDNSIILAGQHGFPADNVFVPDWKVLGTPINGNPNYYHGIDPAWGTYEFGYIPEVGLIPFSNGDLLAPIEVPTADCTAQVQEAIAPLNASIATLTFNLGVANDKVKNLTADLDTANSKIASLTSDLSSAIDKIAALSASLAKSKKLIELLRRRNIPE